MIHEPHLDPVPIMDGDELDHGVACWSGVSAAWGSKGARSGGSLRLNEPLGALKERRHTSQPDNGMPYKKCASCTLTTPVAALPGPAGPTEQYGERAGALVFAWGV